MRACFSRYGAPEAFLYAFDVLELDGQDLRTKPWAGRRKALSRLLENAGDGIRLCDVRHGLGMHRREAARKPLPLGTFAGWD